MREGTVWKANRYTRYNNFLHFLFRKISISSRRASNPISIPKIGEGRSIDLSSTRAAYKLKTGEEKRGGDTKKARRTHEEARKERSKCRVASLGLVITRWLLNK